MVPSRARLSEVFEQDLGRKRDELIPRDSHAIAGTAEYGSRSTRSNAAGFRRDVQVLNPMGMHMRMCSALVTIADRYESRVIVHKDGRAQNADSILGLMALGVNPGDRLQLEAEGPDADEALEACAALFDRRDL